MTVANGMGLEFVISHLVFPKQLWRVGIQFSSSAMMHVCLLPEPW